MSARTPQWPIGSGFGGLHRRLVRNEPEAAALLWSLSERLLA